MSNNTWRGFQAADKESSREMASQYVNAVYYPSWFVYKDRPPGCLDKTSITHIYYAFLGVNEDGTLKSLDDWADNGVSIGNGDIKGCLAALESIKKHDPYLRVIVSLGGANSSKEFAKLARVPEARQRLAQDVRRFCDKHAFDGVDIDWEHPTSAEEGQNYIALLQDLRQWVPRPMLLTTALPIGQYCLKHIDLAAAGNLLDFLNLMAYDFTGSWTEVAGHHAQLRAPRRGPDEPQHHPVVRTCAETGVDYILKTGFPSRKIILGIPAYARYFGQAKRPGQPFEGSGEIDFCDMPLQWCLEAKIDEHTATASFVDHDEGRGFVSFDMPITVQAKAMYVKNKKLGGLFYWHGAADRQGTESLVQTGWSTLHS